MGFIYLIGVIGSALDLECKSVDSQNQILHPSKSQRTQTKQWTNQNSKQSDWMKN